ncbi:class I adenylate-forming enzyme family protein [Paraglaciecola sp.]|uniref:class I adenylate-forming enzyme family protein n=2 Tax=Paraglaciecola sp. TaxID=1920173 RepID=UPI0032660D3E
MLYQQFLNQVEKCPAAIAVCAGEEQVTYQELSDRIDTLSNFMAQNGIRQGVVVAISFPNSIEFVVATFATFKLGAVLLPLNVNYTDEEIESYLEQASAKYLLGNDQQTNRISKLNPELKCISLEGDLSSSIQLDNRDTFVNKALIMFSSGSTGGSKQIIRSYQNLVSEWVIARDTIEITSADVFLCSVPLHHSHGFGNCLIAALLNGAKLVITIGEFNPRNVVKALAKHKVSIYPSATFMLKMLSRIRMREEPDLTSLRLIYSAGAQLELDVIEDFQKTFSKTPYQLYGSTETGAIAINLGGGKLNSVGKPMVNTEVDVISENGETLPASETGEIVVSSPSATTFYEGKPEQSSKTFKDGCYFTGDLGYLDEDGFLFITGRKKAMINVAGLKVDPEEVETVLNRMPQVQEVVVVGKPDGDYGELVKAVIVAKAEVTETQIIEYAKQYLAEYKWPKNIEFRSEIPKSPLGKILRKYL